MRARQINDMNVIAHARAVASRIVIAVNLNVGTHPGGRMQYQRDQVRFRVVPLAKLFSRARGVEISQAGVAHSVGMFVPTKRSFKSEFGFAVGIGGVRWIGFFDGLLGGLAVGRRR